MRKPKPAHARKIRATPKPKRSRARKTQVPKPKSSPHKSRAPPLAAFSIAQFCQMHGFSPAMYWKLKSQGLGPVEMKIGRRVLISAEAAAAWRCERQKTAA
ncbi:hypothetical protein M2189_003553 [Bradyrhizobium japonicum]|nr:hypothetical protein [Bradyrhizobium japonicum]MCS3960350.1 hypothetical protein [Bradyrhizobium japonicum]MCS4002104.1 hypothetical protein [Bradyrhizobium japonicum]